MTQKLGWLLCYCLSVLYVECWALETTVARPPQGAARGVRKTSLSGRPFWAFYNLPYAKPPVGQLRFKDPQPPVTWSHIRDATLPGLNCVQKNGMLLENFPSGSEDCLYLNVFTPELSGSYSVMVWIHGGGWFCGGANFYDPDYLLDHDIVLVTINYRLGALGFLSTQDDAASGNFGLKDQVIALKWVRENIAAFGGNPESVTIFGESAGGASVHQLMLSPLTQGLFHHAISHSGCAYSEWALPDDNAAKKAQKLASVLGCPTESSQALVDCLRDVDDYKIVMASHEKLDGNMVFIPVVEREIAGAFFPKHPSLLKPVNVPWITGITKDEGAFFIAGLYSNKTLFNEMENNYIQLLPKILQYSSLANADALTEKFQKFYFPSGAFSVEGLVNIFSDYFFLKGTDQAVRIQKDVGPVYCYLFSYRGKNSITDILGFTDIDFGVSHVDDLFYLFPVGKLVPGDELQNEDVRTVHTVTKLWTNFAKYGNPTLEDDEIHWPRVLSDDEPEYMEIGQELKVGKGLLKERINFWRPISLKNDTFKDEL